MWMGLLWGLVFWILIQLHSSFGLFDKFMGLLLALATGLAFAASLRRFVRQLLHEEGQRLRRDEADQEWAAVDSPPAAAARTVPAAPAPAAPSMAPAPQAAPARPGRLLAPLPVAQPLPQAAPAAARRPARTRRTDANDPVQQMRSKLESTNIITRLGVLLLFVGLAFLARYAAQAGLFPPEFRMGLIALVGLSLLASGWFLQQKWQARPDAEKGRRMAYAQTLQGAGVAVLYLTVFAALKLFHLFSPSQAFGLLLVICALACAIALLQNGLALAFIGFAGGFAAPLLTSDGSGSFVTLFSYYFLLGLGVVFVAYHRAWRALNILGFLTTFGAMAYWVSQRYEAQDFATLQSFLLAFFALYLLATLFYALRHSLAPRHAMDASLFFGLPLATMGIQYKLLKHLPYDAAFASVGVALVYMLLAGFLHIGGKANATVRRWLIESSLALALVFLSLAVPLALGAAWTAAVWALEGVAVYWLAQRPGHWFGRLAGLGLQGLAAIAWLGRPAVLTQNALHPYLLGLLILALSAWAWVALAQRRERHADALAEFEQGLGDVSLSISRAVSQLEAWAMPFVFVLGLLWWASAGLAQIHHYLDTPAPDAVGRYWLAARYHDHLSLLWLALSAYALHHWARPERRYRLPIAALATWLLLPALLYFALADVSHSRLFTSGVGWLAWPVALLAYGLALRGVDGSRKQPAQPKDRWALHHYLFPLVPLILLGQALYKAVDAYKLWGSAWASVAFLVAATAILVLVSLPPAFAAYARRKGGAWPWQPYGRAHLLWGAGSLAAAVLLGAIMVGLSSAGYARPLPYIPLLNPTDISLALAWLAVASLMQRWAEHGMGPAPATRAIVLAGSAFALINSMWLRMVHHYWAVSWDASALFHSFVTQAGYSILWTTLALGMMWLASRRLQRQLWLLGAALLGLTLLKLLLIDLSNSGGAERIISFIGVGLLMLVVGYLAPMPKHTQDNPA